MKLRIPILALCAATFAGGAFAYGVDVRKSLTRRIPSTCLPLNSRLFRMVQPDGIERIFVRNWDNPNLLHCKGTPWVGVIRPERRMINICTEPSFTGERTEFCFVDGSLRFMSVGSKDYEFKPKDYVPPKSAPKIEWQRFDPTPEELAAADLWHGSGRLRLFSRNPNRAALVFCQLALIALGIALFCRSWVWRLHGVLWALISTLLLFQAQSRGGFLAFVVGAAILGFFRIRRGVSKRVLLVFAAAVLLLGGFAVTTKMANRLTIRAQTRENATSNSSRLFIWKEVPRMIAAAPLGWGLWQSGPAYNSWYEIKCRMHMIGDLFNDHLSRFVEGGFLMGGLYVFAWALIFVWGVRLAWQGGSPVPLAVVAAYFVASTFNPMNYWTPGFYLPLAVLGWGMICRGKDASATGRRWGLLAWAGGVTAVVLAGVAVVAWMAPAQDVPLRVGWLGRRIIVGKGEPKVWVVDDGFVLNGDYFGFPGKELREYYAANPKAEALGLVTKMEHLPDDIERLVVTGTHCWRYLEDHTKISAPHVILLTPPFGSDKIPKNVVKERDLHVLTGEHVARLTGDWTKREPWLVMVPGAEAYIPGWLDIVVRKRQ